MVVLSNNDGCVVARSNEAKALGILLVAVKSRGKMANSPGTVTDHEWRRGAHAGAPGRDGSERIGGVEEVGLGVMLPGDVVVGLEVVDA